MNQNQQNLNAQNSNTKTINQKFYTLFNTASRKSIKNAEKLAEKCISSEGKLIKSKIEEIYKERKDLKNDKNCLDNKGKNSRNMCLEAMQREAVQRVAYEAELNRNRLRGFFSFHKDTLVAITKSVAKLFLAPMALFMTLIAGSIIMHKLTVFTIIVTGITLQPAIGNMISGVFFCIFYNLTLTKKLVPVIRNNYFLLTENINKIRTLEKTLKTDTTEFDACMKKIINFGTFQDLGCQYWNLGGTKYSALYDQTYQKMQAYEDIKSQMASNEEKIESKDKRRVVNSLLRGYIDKLLVCEDIKINKNSFTKKAVIKKLTDYQEKFLSIPEIVNFGKDGDERFLRAQSEHLKNFGKRS